MPSHTTERRDPILSCSVKPDEMDELKNFMAKNDLDGAKLVRAAVEQYTGIDLSGTRHRSLIGSTPMPTPQQIQVMKNNIKYVDEASIAKLFATAPN